MSVKKINSSEFNDLINNNVVLVDFFANWCGPCKMLSPIVEELSNEINDVVFAKIDVDESSNVASDYKVMSIPTLILFKNGKMVNKTVGFQSKEDLKRFILENK
jgi:thioredoxin 1